MGCEEVGFPALVSGGQTNGYRRRYRAAAREPSAPSACGAGATGCRPRLARRQRGPFDDLAPSEVDRRLGEGFRAPLTDKDPLTPTLSPPGARATSGCRHLAMSGDAAFFPSPRRRGEGGRRPGEGSPRRLLKTPHPNPLPARGEGDAWLPAPRHERRRRFLSLAPPAGRGWPQAG